jgi:hypothetical protein
MCTNLLASAAAARSVFRNDPAARPRVRSLLVGILATLALLIATAACSDTSAPVAPSTPTAKPTLDNAASASSGSGATIEHSDFPFGFLGGGDPRDNLAFFVGPLDPVQAVRIKCPDPSVIAPVSPGARAKILTTPSGQVQVEAITRDAHIAVWQFTGPILSPCQLIDAPVVATGVVRYTVEQTNSNVLDGVSGGPGAATLHLEALGVVDLTSGGQARLHATARILIRPDGTLAFDVERVSLTPI